MEDNNAVPAELISNDNISDYNDIILNSSTDLDWAQITYALNVKRLLFITNHKFWLDFHNENLNNSYKYMDFTPEQLCERFIKHILPNIYDYELTNQEEYILNLLDLHPGFERSAQGFVLSNSMEELCFLTDTAAIQPLMASGTLKELGFNAENIHLNKQIIITDTRQQIKRLNFNFNGENAALLSIVFSSDQDLPSSEMLTIEEIYKRFRTAKNNFELKGQLPTNANISVDNLLKKLTTMCELKTAITKLLENFP